jgi:hypothetical protein
MAYERGYRATDDGKILNPAGRVLNIRLRGNQKYPTISFRCGTEITRSGMYGIPAHRFAAYCFFGEAMFAPGIVVRHLDGTRTNFARSNLALGTHSDNVRDIDPVIRSRVGRQARAAQGYRAKNAMFSDEQVRGIRRRVQGGERMSDVAKELGVTRQCVYLIVRRRAYTDVD